MRRRRRRERGQGRIERAERAGRAVGPLTLHDGHLAEGEAVEARAERVGVAALFGPTHRRRRQRREDKNVSRRASQGTFCGRSGSSGFRSKGSCAAPDGGRDGTASPAPGVSHEQHVVRDMVSPEVLADRHSAVLVRVLDGADVGEELVRPSAARERRKEHRLRSSTLAQCDAHQGPKLPRLTPCASIRLNAASFES